jgi:hypothetical protein
MITLLAVSFVKEDFAFAIEVTNGLSRPGIMTVRPGPQSSVEMRKTDTECLGERSNATSGFSN